MVTTVYTPIVLCGQKEPFHGGELFVGGLSFSTSTAPARSFAAVGSVESASVVTDRTPPFAWLRVRRDGDPEEAEQPLAASRTNSTPDYQSRSEGPVRRGAIGAARWWRSRCSRRRCAGRRWLMPARFSGVAISTTRATRTPCPGRSRHSRIDAADRREASRSAVGGGKGQTAYEEFHRHGRAPSRQDYRSIHCGPIPETESCPRCESGRLAHRAARLRRSILVFSSPASEFPSPRSCNRDRRILSTRWSCGGGSRAGLLVGCFRDIALIGSTPLGERCSAGVRPLGPEPSREETDQGRVPEPRCQDRLHGRHVMGSGRPSSRRDRPRPVLEVPGGRHRARSERSVRLLPGVLFADQVEQCLRDVTASSAWLALAHSSSSRCGSYRVRRAATAVIGSQCYSRRGDAASGAERNRACQLSLLERDERVSRSCWRSSWSAAW